MCCCVLCGCVILLVINKTKYVFLNKSIHKSWQLANYFIAVKINKIISSKLIKTIYTHNKMNVPTKGKGAWTNNRSCYPTKVSSFKKKKKESTLKKHKSTNKTRISHEVLATCIRNRFPPCSSCSSCSCSCSSSKKIVLPYFKH